MQQAQRPFQILVFMLSQSHHDNRFLLYVTTFIITALFKSPFIAHWIKYTFASAFVNSLLNR